MLNDWDLNDVSFSGQIELHHLCDQIALVGRVEAEGGLVVVGGALGQLSVGLDLAEWEQES